MASDSDDVSVVSVHLQNEATNTCGLRREMVELQPLSNREYHS